MLNEKHRGYLMLGAEIKDLKNYNYIIVKHFVHIGGKVDNLCICIKVYIKCMYVSIYVVVYGMYL